MSKSLLLFALTVLFVGKIYAEVETEEFCLTIGGPQSVSATTGDGKYLTANGTLKVLLVFVRFKDDLSSHDNWPVGSDPNGYTSFIDSSVNVNSTHYANLTNFYEQMSGGNFIVIGKALSVEAPQTNIYYNQFGGGRGLAHIDVLQNVVDPLINFADYDNWTKDSLHHHTNTPDGIVDMIVMIWRDADWGLGEASFGGGTSFIADGVEIKMGYPSGSGPYCNWPAKKGLNSELKVMVHEMGHWFVGNNHPYIGNRTHLYSVWSMVGGNFASDMVPNAFERELLGWINVPEITTSSDKVLTDYVTTGNAYKWHPANGYANEWIYFENHQKYSIYDKATLSASDNGIWVLHLRNGEYLWDNHDIRIKPSDGFWDWDNPYSTNACFSVNLAAHKKVSINRTNSGKSHRDEMQLLSNPDDDNRWLLV